MLDLILDGGGEAEVAAAGLAQFSVEVGHEVVNKINWEDWPY